MSSKPILAVTESLVDRFVQTRLRSVDLAAPLSQEDQNVQSMPDASPTKWHLAHTTWFLEYVVLRSMLPGYPSFDADFDFLFNSYYEAIGERQPRAQRGLLSRPSLAKVSEYRKAVDRAVVQLLQKADAAQWRKLVPLVTLAIHHEQQHQELMLTDILHAFSCNPFLPSYSDGSEVPSTDPRLVRLPAWVSHPGGLVEVGASPTAGEFAFDNELPNHPVFLQPFAMADRLVSNRDFADFVADDGYHQPRFWLSEGWAAVKAHGWTHPAYWISEDDPRRSRSGLPSGWGEFSLAGIHRLRLDDPVAHLSYYEASAYAQWADARLPTEFEWEAASDISGMQQTFGQVWQWTRSSYEPYPGFKPLEGTLAEYNGKFMLGQQVLRGSSFATPAGHARRSYRNFFPPSARWQFSGLRLARDL